MFFPEKIISIKDTDRVLEVGPGGTAYHRSNILLEKKFDTREAEAQRGFAPKLKVDKKVVYYDGNEFPFQDDEFDYVICSHVLEHIPEEDFDFFVRELQRVAKKGYIEYPTIYYEYLYNFKVHKTYINCKNNVIYYMSKDKSSLNSFSPVQIFFYKTLEVGYDEVIQENSKIFFQGFEWSEKIDIFKTDNLNDLIVENIKLKQRKDKNIKSTVSFFIKKLFK